MSPLGVTQSGVADRRQDFGGGLRSVRARSRTAAPAVDQPPGPACSESSDAWKPAPVGGVEGPRRRWCPSLPGTNLGTRSAVPASPRTGPTAAGRPGGDGLGSKGGTAQRPSRASRPPLRGSSPPERPPRPKRARRHGRRGRRGLARRRRRVGALHRARNRRRRPRPRAGRTPA